MGFTGDKVCYVADKGILERFMPSATQWTSAIDITNGKVYYKTSYNNNIRCIDLQSIDFAKVKYQWHPMDENEQQPIETIIVR